MCNVIIAGEFILFQPHQCTISGGSLYVKFCVCSARTGRVTEVCCYELVLIKQNICTIQTCVQVIRDVTHFDPNLCAVMGSKLDHCMAHVVCATAIGISSDTINKIP